MSFLQPKFPSLSIALGKPKMPVQKKLIYPIRKRKLKAQN